jgi:hypothetical protein
VDYGELLSRAWRLVWNHKFMIALGFLAALGSGTFTGNSSYSVSEEDLPPWMQEAFDFDWEPLIPLFVALACLGLGLLVLFWLVRLAAQGALIDGTSRLERGEPATFWDTLRQGRRALGRLVGLNLLLFGPFVLAAIILLCVWFPLLLLAGVVHAFAQCSAVLHGTGVFASVGVGWRTVRNNAGQVLILLLLLLLIGVAFWLLTATITVPIVLALLAPLVFTFGSSGGPSAAIVAGALIGFLILALVAAVVNSFLKAFQQAAITLAYERLNSGVPKEEAPPVQATTNG